MMHSLDAVTGGLSQSLIKTIGSLLLAIKMKSSLQLNSLCSAVFVFHYTFRLRDVPGEVIALLRKTEYLTW